MNPFQKKIIPLALTLGLLSGCSSPAAATAEVPDAVETADAERGISFNGSIILGRPTNSEMTVSVTPKEGEPTVFVEWGEASNSYTHQTGTQSISQNYPGVFIMDELEQNHVYYYRLCVIKDSYDNWDETEEHHFQMPRSTDSNYSFVIQADSHLLNKADQDLYQRSMDQMASFNPDFMFDLGDAFLNDQVKTDPAYQKEDVIRSHYLQQLPFFSTVAADAPLFLTMGNHEGEYGYFMDGTAQNLTAMATLMRKTYYMNPEPNEFYSGNAEQEDICGSSENYYAFSWGDALYVSIDPYRYTTADPYNIANGWDWTLGKEQYDWFKQTLESSTAKYKFVFSHHAIGNIRGGEEVASLYEWGGYNNKGQYQFDEMRPGWGEPIQKIMEDTGVTIFFQGHDHLFARETVNGVIYQTLPKPAESTADKQSNPDAFPDADVLGNSGFLHVTVTNEHVQVDYERMYDMLEDIVNPSVGTVYSYTVDDQHQITQLIGSSEDFSSYGKGTPIGYGD